MQWLEEHIQEGSRAPKATYGNTAGEICGARDPIWTSQIQNLHSSPWGSLPSSMIYDLEDHSGPMWLVFSDIALHGACLLVLIIQIPFP